ncbi:hypothetical protein VF21_07602 [Pseudogymnoascus sp. 05NY08]|nr:hypothetical protein VF21_07602 [Pseudogymnoascus sp. 05NY08]
MVALGLAAATPTTTMPTTETDVPTTFTMVTNIATPTTKPETTTFRTAVEKITTTMMMTPIFRHTHHITATATAPGMSNSFHISSKRNTPPRNWTGRVVRASTVRLWAGLRRTAVLGPESDRRREKHVSWQ